MHFDAQVHGAHALNGCYVLAAAGRDLGVMSAEEIDNIRR